MRFESKFFSDGVKVWFLFRVLQTTEHEVIVSIGSRRHLRVEKGMVGFEIEEGEELIVEIVGGYV